MSHFVPSVTLLVAFVMAAGPGSQQRPEPPTQLQNTGFESAVLHEGWTVHVYGAQPKPALDRTVLHEGRLTAKSILPDQGPQSSFAFS